MNRNKTLLGRFSKFSFTLLLTGSLVIAPDALAEPEFVTMDQYMEIHPGQKPISAAFNRQVQDKSVPVSNQNHTPVKIAVVYPALQASDYWRRSVSSFEARLKELKVNYQMDTYFSRPSGDIQLQNQQLLKAVQSGADYLIFTFNQKHHQRLIEKLLVRGKPKLILQNITTPVSRWLRHRPMMYVGFDHATGSQKMAKELATRLNHQGKYLMLYFSDGYISEMRGDTFAKAISKHKSITQVGSFYTDGNRSKATNATLDTLRQHPDIELIFANSTDIALGAIDALEKLKPKQPILVNGWGGGDAELNALLDKKLSLTVMRMNDDNGVAMAEAIKLDIENKPEQVPHVYSGELTLVDQNISPAELDQLKKRAFRYSGVTQ